MINKGKSATEKPIELGKMSTGVNSAIILVMIAIYFGQIGLALPSPVGMNPFNVK